MSERSSSIGIFDSGFGGLSVMRAIRAVLPYENVIYYGDTAHLPYGNKSAETILKYSLDNATFLMNQGIKMLVVACHTVCSVAFDELQRVLNVPIVGVIQPSVSEAIEVTKTGQIAILGTRMTVSRSVHQQKISEILPHAEVTSIACPLFVPLVEEGYAEHPLSEMAVQEYLRPLKKKEIDTVLLGCTHYPLLENWIQKELGPNVILVNPAMKCAENIKKLLEQNDLINLQKDIPHYQFFVSDDPEKFRLLGKTFLNYPIEHVQHVCCR